MRKIRTVTECVKEILKDDPQNAITEFLIRKLASYEKIRSYKTGNKILIDYESLLCYLESREYDLPMEQIIMR